MKALYFFTIIFTLSFILTSCSTVSKMGVLGDKYSRGRNNSHSDRVYKPKESDEKSTKTIVKENEKSNKKDKSAANAPQIVKANKGTNDYRPNNAGNATAETMKRAEIVQSSFKFIGIPYNSAGNTPDEGFDCSGFTNYVFNINGYKISGPSSKLANMGVFRMQSQLKPGDLVFFGLDGTVNHVGMVTNSNKDQTYFIHASSSMGIKVDEINSSEYWRKRFMFGRDVLFELMTSKENSSRADIENK